MTLLSSRFKPSEYLSLPDGHAIAVRIWPLRKGEKAKAVIHLSHGMSEHSARYAYLALHLNAAGFIVVAHDHRGHGLSVTGSEALGHFADYDGWEKVIADVKQVNQYIKQKFPDLPIVLFGHSMGSFIAQYYAIQHPDSIAALILCGGSLIPDYMSQSLSWAGQLEKLYRGKRSANHGIHALTFKKYNRLFKPNRTECDWLSRDPQQVDFYVADPLCGFLCSSQLWLDFAYGVQKLFTPSFHSQLPKEIPYYLIAGSKDGVSNFGKDFKKLSVRIKKMGVKNITTRLYPDARHELFNETNRDEVIRDLINWLNGYL